MGIFLLTFHILITLALIGVILLQPSKGDDYGGNHSFTQAGKGGFIVLLTRILGFIFFANCIVIALFLRNDAQFKKQDPAKAPTFQVMGKKEPAIAKKQP